MKQPFNSLDNIDAMVEYFGGNEPDYRMMRALHFIFARAFNVQTIYAHAAQQKIHEHLMQGGQLFIAANHREYQDPLMLAAMIQNEDVFHPLRGKVTIPGNIQFFNKPFIGGIIMRSGAVPVIRAKDIEQMDGEYTDDHRYRRKIANTALQDIMIHKINNGYHVAIFPEGTRGKGNKRGPAELLPFYEGIGKIACSIERPDNLQIVCAGIYYHPESRIKREATIAIAEPFGVPETSSAVVDQSHLTIQQSVEHALAYNS